MPRRILKRRYELLERIGSGGMAMVYKARDLESGREVAVKTIREEHARGEKYILRFRREARIASELLHPNIVRVLDYDSSSEGAFVVMELIDGYPLGEVVGDGRYLDFERAYPLMRDVLSAAAYAHSRKVVHRDIKPDNVLVDRKTGRAYLADFGIAKALEATELTSEGARLGTPVYMSPEQIRGRNVSPRSDIYSLGVLFYEMLTGRPPFTGDDPITIGHAHVYDPPPPMKKRGAPVPPELEALVMKALEKDPRRRHSSAASMLRKLDAAARKLGLEVPRDDTASPRSRKKKRGGAASGEGSPGHAGGKVGGGEAERESARIELGRAACSAASGRSTRRGKGGGVCAGARGTHRRTARAEARPASATGSATAGLTASSVIRGASAPIPLHSFVRLTLVLLVLFALLELHPTPARIRRWMDSLRKHTLQRIRRPLCTKAYLEDARELFGSGATRLALLELDRYRTARPSAKVEVLELCLDEAAEALRARRMEDARLLVEYCSKLSPADARLRLLLCSLLLKEGRVVEFRKEFHHICAAMSAEELLEYLPRYAALLPAVERKHRILIANRLFMQGKLLFRRGAASEAERWFEGALRIFDSGVYRGFLRACSENSGGTPRGPGGKT